MYQELSPVVIHLRYVLRESDLLMVEEREAHLDPQPQRALARAMVRLVNRGPPICMTTHSDFLSSRSTTVRRLGVSPVSRTGRSRTS